MAPRNRAMGGLLAAALVIWFVTDEAEPQPERRQMVSRHHRPWAIPAAEFEMEPERDTAVVIVHLTRSTHLRLQMDMVPVFDPGPLIPLADDALLPQSDAADALQDVLSADEAERPDAVADFLAEMFDTAAPQPDTGNAWTAIVELEAERLAVDVDYEADQAREMAAIQRVHTSRDPDDLKALIDLPIVAKRNEDLIEMALDFAEAHPDSEVGDIARLYAAQALADWDSEVFSELRSQDVLLDALHRSEDPDIVDRIIGMLTPLAGTGLEPEDIEVLEDSYEIVDPALRASLARYLMDQRYAASELAEASIWADQLEAELLSGHPWGSDFGDRWWELDEARDRLAADMDVPARNWRSGFDRLARQCWKATPEETRNGIDGPATVTWTWDGDWMASSDQEQPVVDCVMERGDQVPAPERPIDVELVLHFEGETFLFDI